MPYPHVSGGYGNRDSMKGRRRHMSPAQKAKRSEIAEAIHRENPDMPLKRKFRIATAAAMRKR